jgi:hypothetical protein
MKLGFSKCQMASSVFDFPLAYEYRKYAESRNYYFF